jgi:hypothetical protein
MTAVATHLQLKLDTESRITNNRSAVKLIKLNPFTTAPFFGEKDDFEINAQKILEEFCLPFFLCVWMGKWLDYRGNFFFFAFCI